MKNWDMNKILVVLGSIIVLMMIIMVGTLGKLYDALAAIVAVTVV